ncbi:MAG TPA: hypothetical protein VGO00_18810, partial [Kofleriaceae bacterium]|nr:hypothetical protein [Kofleriaceae bacterium]
MTHFAISVVVMLAACGGSADPASGSVGATKATAPVVTSKPVTPRADLATRARPLAATIETPAGTVLSDGDGRGVDPVGLTTDEPEIHVAVGGVTLDLSIGHGQLVDAAEDAHDNASRFHQMAERLSPHAWSRAYAWSDGECFVTGGSKAADIRCHTHELKISCDAARQLVEVCATLEPKGAPLVPPTNLATTFPNTTSPQARTALGAAAVAIVKDNRAAFEMLVAPAGITIGKRRLSPSKLHAALATKSVGQLTGLTCQHDCVWTDNTSGSHDGEHVEMT